MILIGACSKTYLDAKVKKSHICILTLKTHDTIEVQIGKLLDSLIKGLSEVVKFKGGR